MQILTAADVIALLNLKPLPVEGGFYREMYRSTDVIPSAALAPHYGGARAAGTAIFYLLTPETFSALHRLATDEIFHFYLGDVVEMLQLWPDGTGRALTLGTDLRAGEHCQVVVPRGVWQGSRLKPGGAFALLGTTMAPGFEFVDFEAGERGKLTELYPEFAERIGRLTANA